MPKQQWGQANWVRSLVAGVVCAAALGAGSASAQVRITEWMYNPTSDTPGFETGSEFVEFTNLGPAPVDFTGWSFDDVSRTPGSFSLSGFGTVAVGESVIMSELSASVFRTLWNLPASVKVVGGNTNNLGRGDEINLYNASNVLIDRLTYDDRDGGPRTVGTSGRPGSFAALGANNDGLWVFSGVGDVENSFRANGGQGDLASPGFTSFATTVIPVPGAALLMLGGLGVLGFAGRRKLRA
jgi:hypothetical protein